VADDSRFWRVRCALEDWASRRVYGEVSFGDGQVWTFFPAAVNCLEAPEGPRWVSVGLCWKPEKNDSEYAYLRLDEVTDVRELEAQPDQ
jgi:hypothetical protein